MNGFWTCLRKYRDETGRATRRELLSFLFGYAVCVVLLLVISDYYQLVIRTDTFKWLTDQPTVFWRKPKYPPIMYPMLTLFGTLMMIPFICVVIRRLHDTNRSAYWIFSFIVLPVFIILLLLPGKKSANRFGPNPRVGIDTAPENVPPENTATTDQPNPAETPSDPA